MTTHTDKSIALTTIGSRGLQIDVGPSALELMYELEGNDPPSEVIELSERRAA